MRANTPHMCPNEQTILPPPTASMATVPSALGPVLPMLFDREAC